MSITSMLFHFARNCFIVGIAAMGCGTALAQSAAPPIVQWLTSTPSSVPSGVQTTLRWHVDGADTVTIDHGIGSVAAQGTMLVSTTATTTYTLTATNINGTSTRSHILVVTANRNTSGLRFVNMISPVGGQRFTAPAILRVFAAAFDDGGVNCGVDGSADRCASRVDFYVDDTVMAQVPGVQSEYWVFKATFGGVAAGVHRVWARAIFTNPAAVLDSESMWITVDAPPAYAQTLSLTQDVVLTGTQNYEVLGTATGRTRINGNGHRISAVAGWTGHLTLQFADVFNLGAASDNRPAIDIETNRAVQIEDCIFENTGSVSLFVNGAASASIRRNEFRSNMSMQESQQPEFGSDASYPAIQISGNSTASKFFQGNAVGIGWADFRNADNWLIGGDMDGDSNIVVAPRGGIWAQNMTRTAIRRNLIYHVYYGGWSQGNVMEVDSSSDIVIEHNIIGGGSWPIRGLGGTLRYNLVIDAGHQWLWITGDNASVHHNVFAGGDGDVAGIWTIYEPKNVDVHNNTIDGLGRAGFLPFQVGGNSTVSLKSNAIVNMRDPPAVVIESGGTLAADYNLFSGQQGTPRNYSDNRFPAHDAGVLNSQLNPKFTEASEPWRYSWEDLWSRRITVGQVLANYRTRYTPAAGSPLTDAGDPGSANGNDIGAIGSGQSAIDDLFGLAGVDIVPPAGTILINGGAARTNQSSVTLTLAAVDNASGVVQMRFSNDGMTFGSPQAFATTAGWTLAAGDGTRTVSVQFRDGAGNWSQAFMDGILVAPVSQPLALTDVQSRKPHGAAGVFGLHINPAAAINGPITIEPRVIGAGHLLVFQFDDAITNPGTVSVRDQNNAAIGTAGTPGIGGIGNNEVSVSLTGIPDGRRATVSLAGVNGTLNVSVSLGFLLGNVANSHVVGSADLAALRTNSGSVVRAGNFLYDLNLSGRVTAADIAVIKARNGAVLN